MTPADDSVAEGTGAPDDRPGGRPATDLRGTPPAVVRRAVREADPLPGTDGFAGRLDGRLVRDPLGRYPLFTDGGDPTTWQFEPAGLDDPELFPAGHRQTDEGVTRVWSLPSPNPRPSLDAALQRLRGAIDRRLDAVETAGLAVGFSGGVDSALLADRLDRPCYVAGFPDSHDVHAARRAARRLDCDLTVVELTHDRLVEAIPEVVSATGRTNAMDVSIALPLSCLAERVAADGHDRLALGQGADELFGGYAKVARAPNDPRVAAETVRAARREVVESLPDQLPRDVLTVRAGGVEPVVPFLHDEVITAALELPGDAFVGPAGERKWAFRLATRTWLPDPLAFREKKAMQYGSHVSRELDRLARQAGFKRRMDDHVTRYVQSLVE